MTDSSIHDDAEWVLEHNRVAVFIVAYNAERHIESVIRRIPSAVREKLVEIYVIDDSSSDSTFQVARKLSEGADHPLNIYRTPYNQGYGGNQILGYQHAIEMGHDIVVLLHGDGQYAPEELPRILAPYRDHEVGAVFGSRFMTARKALAGGMPRYKYYGNRILTFMQNRLLKTRFSEMHSGYRSYRMKNMKQLPFRFNSKGFDFDADIIIQWVEAGFRIVEVDIPTYYGDEICRVNGTYYAFRCIRAAVINLLMRVELFYDPKFDLSHLKPERRYIRKNSPRSLHAYVRNYPLEPNLEVLDLGGGDGESVATDLIARGHRVTCIDSFSPKTTHEKLIHCQKDLDGDWPKALSGQRFQLALALDVVEHLKEPEKGLDQLFEVMDQHGLLLISTGNVAFFPIRFMLFIGAFNYGRRGILDLTHKRLFTLKSFRRVVTYHGFEVKHKLGFGIPLTDLAPNNPLSPFLEKVSHHLARFWPGLFAYQILLVCQRPLSHRELMKETFSPQ